VNSAVSRFLNKFKSAARNLETKDAPRYIQSCAKINGFPSDENAANKSMDARRNSDVVIAPSAKL